MLIECPECQKKISDKANSCPNCGYSLKKIEKQSPGCFMQTLNAGCLIFVIILIIIFISGVFSGIKHFNKKKTANPQKIEVGHGNKR